MHWVKGCCGHSYLKQFLTFSLGSHRLRLERRPERQRRTKCVLDQKPLVHMRRNLMLACELPVALVRAAIYNNKLKLSEALGTPCGTQWPLGLNMAAGGYTNVTGAAATRTLQVGR